MANRIRDVVVLNHRLDPHETELRIVVELAQLTPTTEIRGRLMGPRCMYSSTIEIAYPMREVERGKQIVMRVIIPEASWWEPQTPFLYQGPLELWQDGAVVERREVCHGIRSVQLTPTGLRLNGNAFVLRGRVVEPPCVQVQGEAWHAGGINVVLTPFEKLRMEPELWPLADRYGFFVIERSQAPSHFLRYRNESNDHASVLGWVLHPELLELPGFDFNDRRTHSKSNLFGVASTSTHLPSNASFLLCSEDELASRMESKVPKVVLVRRLPEVLPTVPDVIGWIEGL